MGLTDQLAGRRVYFDTNIFIYLLEGFAQAELQIQEIRAAILSGSCEVYTSELTLCELLVLPFRNKNSEMIKHYRQFLEESGAVTLVPTSRETYIRASHYRGEYGLRTPDAVHVASADEAKCSNFLTNDANLKLPKSITRVAFSTK